MLHLRTSNRPCSFGATAPRDVTPFGFNDLTINHATEVAKFLDNFEWDHFVTLTTRRPITEENIARLFKDRFIRKLAFTARCPIPYFYAVEGGDATGGYPHLHALISGSKGVSIEQVRRAWQAGVTDARRYEASRGAAYYVTKGIIASPDQYNLSRRMPPRRLSAESAVPSTPSRK
jgi:hypothetical protein